MESVLQTYNYSMFKFGAWNRDIKEKSLNKLDKAVKEVGWKCYPIIVNEDYEVIDGQHRLTYAKAHHLPVYYVIIPQLKAEDCVEMNNIRTSWSIEDYVKLYAVQGNENYERLSDLLKEYDFAPVSTIVSLLNSQTVNGQSSVYIKKGMLKLSDEDIDNIVGKFDFLQEVSPYVKAIKGRSASVYSALSFIYDLDSVNKLRFKKQIKNLIGTIVPPVDVENAIKEIDRIYNYKITKDNYVDIVSEYKAWKRNVYDRSVKRLHEVNISRYGNRGGK